MGFRRVGAAVLLTVNLTFFIGVVVSLSPVNRQVIKPVNKPVIKLVELPVNIKVNKPVVKLAKEPVIKDYYRKTSDGLKLSKLDYELLVRIAHSEAGDEGIASQIGVVNVVLNRVASNKFPNTVQGVIYQKHQFAVVADGAINKEPESMNYEVVDRAIAGENTVGNCLFFWAEYVDKSNYLWSKTIQYKYDRTVFAN